MEGQDVQSAVAKIDNGKFGKREIRFETGRLARQAAGTALVFLDDDSMLLSATTASKTPRDQFDFFPLTVDVEERMYAAGKIPGSFFLSSSNTITSLFGTGFFSSTTAFTRLMVSSNTRKNGLPSLYVNSNFCSYVS